MFIFYFDSETNSDQCELPTLGFRQMAVVLASAESRYIARTTTKYVCQILVFPFRNITLHMKLSASKVWIGMFTAMWIDILIQMKVYSLLT